MKKKRPTNFYFKKLKEKKSIFYSFEKELDIRYKKVLINPTFGKSWEEVEINLFLNISKNNL